MAVRSLPADRVTRVGLTGGIATGKSHVRAGFERLGVPTIDSDVLARDAVAPGSRGLTDVVGRFGPSILRSDGSLDRDNLAAIVFADPQLRKALEEIVHPYVRRRTDDWFAALPPDGPPYALADIPLLYEVGREKDFDAVIVVACSAEHQYRRLLHRGMTDEQARQRLAAQWPLDDKVARANHVIWTDGTFEETEQQIQAVDVELRRL